MLREAGAKEVHIRLTAPEIKNPCYFGIDIPTTEELISNHMTPDQIAEHIGADSCFFLPVPKLKECISNPEDFCYACYTGNYPVKIKEN